MPPHIAYVLSVVAILAEYGRHLADTIERRAAARSFSTIARFFGTGTVSVILAHIYRGVMRAVALERVLRERAARGRDLRILAPRGRAWDAAEPATPPPPATATAPLVADAPPAPTAAQPPARRRFPPEPLTLANLPSMAQLETEARRRTAGRSIVDICGDLGVAPTLCEGAFWNRIFSVIYDFRGSFNNIMLEMRRREKQFDRDVQDRNRNLDWPDDTTAGIRRAVGFLIGEPMIDPFRVAESPGTLVVAAATGPP